jgi:putative ABC transport system ATP-binding protein
VIALRQVWKTYRQGERVVHALQDVSLTLAPGESVALIGPSGAGKSTLLSLLGLMDVPSQGEIVLAGKPTNILSDAARSNLRGHEIGFVFQSFNLIAELNAWQNVALPLKYLGVSRRERRERALDMLARVGLADRAEHRPAELSGGQEQRVAIARALIAEPSLVLADEPTGNLDSKTSEQILQLLLEVSQDQKTLVTVTHSSDVAALMQRQISILDGRLQGSVG